MHVGLSDQIWAVWLKSNSLDLIMEWGQQWATDWKSKGWDTRVHV